MSKKFDRIIREEVRRFKTKKILKEQLNEQRQVQYMAVIMLTEGPMSNVWQGLKDAGSSALSALGGLSRGSQKAGASAHSERSSKAVQMMEKAIKDAESQRRKFNSQVMKSAQIMSAYHDSVVNLNQLYGKLATALGPAAMQVDRQVADMVKALEDDLVSEVSQIEAMFKSLKNTDVSLDKMLGSHKKEMGRKREGEADASARMRSDYGRTNEKMPSKMKLPKVDVPHRSKDPNERHARRKRIEAGDKEIQQRYDDEMGEIQKAYEETSKELFKRLMKAKDPEEKSELTKQMYDLTKQKVEREKELKNFKKTAAKRGVGAQVKR